MAHYGLSICFHAAPGKRGALERALLDGSRLMAAAGCRLHLVSQDAAMPDAVWVTEVWDSGAAHDAAVAQPAAAELTTRVLALTREVGPRVVTNLIGGHGLDPAA